jgi:hypothetical protein
MSEAKRPISILPVLDRFQIMKRGRMKFLLREIESAKEIGVSEWLSKIAVRYGIRRNTGIEYLNDWQDGGYITIENGVIKFLRNVEE